jgi:hypothetical protein
MRSALYVGGDGDGGSSDGGPPVTFTGDLANKIRRYLAADPPLRAFATRGNDGLKRKACVDLATALSGISGMAPDAFAKRWTEYGTEVVPVLKKAALAYDEYLAFAKKTALSRSNDVGERDLRAVSDVSSRLQKYSGFLANYRTMSGYDKYTLLKQNRRGSSRGYDDDRFGRSNEDPAKAYPEIEAAYRSWADVIAILKTIRSDTSRSRLVKFLAGAGQPTQPDAMLAALTDAQDHMNTANRDMQDSNEHRSVHVDDVRNEVEAIARSLEELVASVREKMATDAAGTAFDPRKIAFDDFLTYSEQSDIDVRAQQPKALLAPEEVPVFREKLTLPYFNERVGSALIGTISEMRKRAAGWLRQAASSSSSSGSGTGSSQELASRKQAVQQLDALLSLAENKLAYPSPQGPPAELRDLVNKLSNAAIDVINGGKKINTVAPSASSSSSPSAFSAFASSGQGASGNNGMHSSSGMPGIGFLYRTIDPMRIARYLEQLERFRDEANDSQADEFAATQANRLAETVLDLERQATAIAAAGIDDAGTGGATSAGELSLRLRQLGYAKVTAAKSFARGVRASTAAYVSMHLRFVSERHGEAMRYMRYWDDLVASAKEDAARLDGFGADDAIRTALTDHKKIVKELMTEARKVIIDKIRAKVLESQRESLGSAGQPRLDNEQQTEVDVQLDRLSEWLVDRAELVEETYMRGAPTLLESVTEPTTLMLYGLKVVRLGCASAALNVACGTFETMYTRNVYTLDLPPPNPARLVGLTLAIDAALTAIVLLVLYTSKRLFKTADNDFPIDAPLLWAWVHDYLAATLAIGALSLIVGEVIRSKKYFRYKYEGERGIRAMREMMWYIYCVLTPIPFYRLLG